MANVAVFTGHGTWNPKDGWAKVPDGSKILFYTGNAQALTGETGLVDIAANHLLDEPEVINAKREVANYRLFPPGALTYWHKLPTKNYRTELIVWDEDLSLKNDHPQAKNAHFIQSVAAKQEGVPLSELFAQGGELFENRTLVWAACRVVELKKPENQPQVRYYANLDMDHGAAVNVAKQLFAKFDVDPDNDLLDEYYEEPSLLASMSANIAMSLGVAKEKVDMFLREAQKQFALYPFNAKVEIKGPTLESIFQKLGYGNLWKNDKSLRRFTPKSMAQMPLENLAKLFNSEDVAADVFKALEDYRSFEAKKGI